MDAETGSVEVLRYAIAHDTGKVINAMLVVPAATKWMPVLTPFAAGALALESLVLALWFARHSLALRATNPLVYVVVGGVIAAFVAYGRYMLSPLS